MGIFLSTDAGTNWTQIKIMNVADSQAEAAALAPSNVSTIYVAGYISSGTRVIFRSTDGGAAWTQGAAPSSSAQVSGLAVHPSSPSTLYATTSWGGCFKSTDGASSWTKMDKAPSGANCVAINPSNPNEVFIGSNDGVYYSADGGATWTDLSAGLAATDVVWIEIDAPARLIYAGIEGGGICRRSF